MVGCNGSGKSTMLENIKEELHKEKIPMFFYNNEYDGGSNSIGESVFLGDINFAATAWTSSEGENITLNLSKIASKWRNFILTGEVNDVSTKLAKSFREVYVQTGLPCEYLDDADELKEVLTGHYDVTIKIGNNEEKRVIFDLKKDAINVMEQPKGTMISAVYDNHGQPLADRIGILRQNTLIVDIGFGTEDLFSIKSSVNNKQNTYSDTAMKSVFENTIKDINDEKHTNFKIFEFQKYLEDGVIPIFIRGKGNIKPHIEPYDFTELLNKNNKELCEKSINRILYEYDNLIKYNYLIVTGGTGESRFDMIEDALSGLTVTVIKGNENAPDLPFVFSNVRGYYMSAYLRLLNQG